MILFLMCCFQYNIINIYINRFCFNYKNMVVTNIVPIRRTVIQSSTIQPQILSKPIISQKSIQPISDYNTAVKTKINTLAQNKVTYKPIDLKQAWEYSGQLNSDGTIFVNKLDNPFNPNPTIAHEVEHLLDAKTQKPMEYYQQFKTNTFMDKVRDIEYTHDDRRMEYPARRFEEYSKNPQQFKQQNPNTTRIFEQQLNVQPLSYDMSRNRRLFKMDIKFNNLTKAKIYANKFKQLYGYKPEIFKISKNNIVKKFVIVKPKGLVKIK